ncbi:FAD-dependent oxidoreductase [Pontivivens nitratireducens]|uniref:FAD-dependent oxidoreductase n=1 Tax=Pontivivens nitratireducens TaxID=2758038 RepID=A0A6G7VLC4_9RHOB|nr:FAD-dependent oxidoreductase [Pontibrevibacter nitratireducens]QIK40666.1 FAD-dependent oxidoreductase [Pontibrevibacter nitratireducens]
MQIAIVGAGIAGLATAVACARRGMQVTVFERAPELGEVGAGIQIGANGMAVLTAFGLADAVRRVGVSPSAVQMRSADATPLMRIAMGADAARRWGHVPVNLHRADLIALLADAARAAKVQLVTGVDVGGAQATDGVLHVGGRTERFDLIVGADGVRSGLRAQIAGVSEPRYTGHAAWRALIPHEGTGTVTNLTVGRDRHLVTYPIRGGRMLNVVAVVKRREWTGEGWAQEDDPDNLRAAFANWNDMADAVLAQVRETYLWGLFDHAPLQSWSRGKLVLVGDACHPMLPFLAQGATQGLEDAWVLAETLAAGAPVSAYEAERKPRATRVQRAARAQGRLDHVGFPWRPFVHLGMRGVGAVAPDFAARRFDWLYAHDVTRTAIPN